MSAKKRWHEDVTEEDGQPTIAHAMFSRMQSTGGAKYFAPDQEPQSDASESPEGVTDDSFRNDETISTLLRAIESAEITRHLRAAIQPSALPVCEPPEAVAPISAFTLPIEAQPLAACMEPQSPADPLCPPSVDGTPEVDRILETLQRAIQNTEVAASIRNTAPANAKAPDATAVSESTSTNEAILAGTIPAQAMPTEHAVPEPPAATPPLTFAVDEIPGAVELVSGRAEPAPEPLQQAATSRETPVVASPGQSRSARESLLRTPILVMLSGEIGRLCAKIGLSTEHLDRAELRLERWFENWISPDPRRSKRLMNPPLVAYHWIVDTPQALKIADISSGGLHLVIDERWPPGNIISMTLQRTDKAIGAPESWIAVDFVVVRWCPDGLAGAFIPSWPGLAYVEAGRAANCADKKTLEQFVKRLGDATLE